MLVTKIIVCILALISLFIARMRFEEDLEPTLISNLWAGCAGILGIIFCVLLITTNWNAFTIPKILLFISVCLYIMFKEEFEACSPFWMGIVITVVAYIVAGITYANNLEKCEIPDVTITNYTIICAKDNTSIIGDMSGSILYVQASTSEKSVYKYYYQLEDGGIKQGTIPADSTTIYLIKSEENPHLETVVTTAYYINNNNNPATHCLENSETTYNLYVPEGSIANVYEFNAD